jgi:hypothetical protein
MALNPCSNESARCRAKCNRLSIRFCRTVSIKCFTTHSFVMCWCSVMYIHYRCMSSLRTCLPLEHICLPLEHGSHCTVLCSEAIQGHIPSVTSLSLHFVLAGSPCLCRLNSILTWSLSLFELVAVRQVPHILTLY